MTWYVSFSSCTCCQKCELIFTQSYTIEIWCHTSLCWRKRHSSWMHYIHNWNTDGLWFCGNVKLHLPAFLYGFFSVCSKHALQTTNHRLWKRQEQDIKIIRDPIGKKAIVENLVDHYKSLPACWNICFVGFFKNLHQYKASSRETIQKHMILAWKLMF